MAEQGSKSLTAADAPTSVFGIARYLGPGLIIAASVVGSGELIGATKSGAQAGIALLWMIIIGCIIKIPVQLSLGHYSLSSGKGTIQMLAELPGPRIGISWACWLWLAMQLASIGQLGGIAHGVGQALALSVPLTGDYRELLAAQEEWDDQAALAGAALPSAERPHYNTSDDIVWAALMIVLTIALLLRGRYKMVEWGSTAMVVTFTAVTVACVVALQFRPEWSLRANDLATGLSFQLPSGSKGLSTALATLGIIGIGATELVGWIYWLRERGYSAFTGVRSDAPEWAIRANGWMRVMRWDAICSALIYTFATIAFFVLGATVLHRQGLDPEGNRMIGTLAEMYTPIFGPWTPVFFLCGAFAVLYSTLFVATATHARVCTDALIVLGGLQRNERRESRLIRRFIVVLSLAAFGFLLLFRQPVMLILISGILQAIMLPVLGLTALHYRWHGADRRIAHGRGWDAALLIAFIALVLSGGWMIVHLVNEGLGG